MEVVCVWTIQQLVSPIIPQPNSELVSTLGISLSSRFVWKGTNGHLFHFGGKLLDCLLMWFEP